MYSLTADNIIGIGIEKGLGEGGTGVPLVRPMVMEFQDDPNTYGMDTQFMNGPSFLVAPVVEDSSIKEVYLPEGIGTTMTTEKRFMAAVVRCNIPRRLRCFPSLSKRVPSYRCSQKWNMSAKNRSMF